jgi:two-component system, OmpR family, sensor histidine kinase VanS
METNILRRIFQNVSVKYCPPNNIAIRHTPDGGCIKVSVARNGNNCLVEIENESEQIDDHEMENIWEKFYRLDKSRNRELGGAGLGLNIVKNILLLHGARFGAINTDHGVKFFFELPIA